MDNMLASQLGRNIEIYVDDMVIKSKNKGNLITETFDTLRKANMKLNPKKCTFEVKSGQFLGYMITNEGIQANPEKVQAIINMTSLKTLREVQALNGKLSKIGRFLAKSTERSLPFFKTLKGCLNKKDFWWNAEAKAFQDAKSHLLYLLPALNTVTKAPKETSNPYLATLQMKPSAYPSKPENSGRIANWAIERTRAHNSDGSLVFGSIHGFLIDSKPSERFIRSQGRSKNKRVDALSKLASSSFAHLRKSVSVEVVPCRSIEAKAINTIEEVGDLDGPIISYLTNGALPEEQIEARKIRIKAPQYLVKQNILYRKGYLTQWLQCVGPVKADYVLREAHLGSCGAHTEPRSIAQKASRLGYYWPTMYRDATRVWGIDIVGSFLEAPGRVKFLILAIDYFTKWTEAEPVATITGHKTRLGKAKGQWVEELPNVLWGYRTTARVGNGCTPFSLVYGSEVVLPPEIGLPTYRISTFQPAMNDTGLPLNLDLLEEQREMASLRNARTRQAGKKDKGS
ncbi:reverse transcriptase domain-containing protein [Tanacetum coccineum]